MCSNSFRHFLLFTLLAFIAFAPAWAQAQLVDPKIKWETLETEHFYIVYDSKHYELGKRYAVFAEQAFAAISPVFKEFPSKTTLVLNDQTDLANGYATDMPYPLIMSYPVLPLALDSISDYGNWGLELVTHEYTHVLNMEPAHGVFGPLRSVFGSIVRPNMLLPRWYLEGLAVEMETRYSSFGRLRSANFLSIVRAMVEEGTLRKEDISRINEVGIPDWPGGMRPYLMGALMWNEIVKAGGDNAIYELNERNSRRFPFFINAPLHDLLGVNYQGMLDRTYAHAEKNANAQIAKIQSAPAPGEIQFAQEGFFSHSPVISPDGTKLLYIARTHNKDSILKLVTRKGNEPFTVGEGKTLYDDDESIQRASWFPDSRFFVYDAADTFHHYYLFSDLYKYDLEKKKKKQITHGLRAREPVVSADGTMIAFVQNTGDGTRLAAVNGDGDNVRVLYEPGLQTRVSRPEFLSVGKIIFAEKVDDGVERFRILDLKTKQTHFVLDSFAPVHFARKTDQGLLFVSDKSGAANLYLVGLGPDAEPVGQVRAVSNTTTRLMTGEYDARTSDLIYSRLNAAGPLLMRSPETEWSKAAKQPPQVASLVDTEWPHYVPPPITQNEPAHEDYSSWPYMLPRYWMPWLYASSQGAFISASTSASDPLYKQAYSLTASYDTFVHKGGFFGTYENTVTRFPLGVAADDFYESISSGNLSRHNTDALATAASFVPYLNDYWFMGTGWQYTQTDYGHDPQVRNGPTAFVKYENVKQKGEEISPEENGDARLSHTEYLPGLGTLGYGRTDFSSDLYLSKRFWPLQWLPERHVLATSVNGTWEPDLHNSFLGPTSAAGPYQIDYVSTRYVMRGYQDGSFIGRNFLQGSMEYRFPLWYQNRGFGTAPLFLRRWHGAVFGDVATLDGYYYDVHWQAYRQTHLGRYFVGTGAEVRADTTLFYQVPLTVSLGLYYGTQRDASTGKLTPYVTIGL